MKNKYTCTYCKDTECNISIESPYDVGTPDCLIHAGAYAEWEVSKPVVDKLKRRLAVELIEHHHETEGAICECVYCCQYAEGQNHGDIKHKKNCIVTAAKQYIEGLEASKCDQRKY